MLSSSVTYRGKMPARGGGAILERDTFTMTMQYFQLGENGDLPAVAQFAPFKAVVAIEQSLGQGRREQISKWLVESGALYVMLSGVDCEAWRQSIRQANLEKVDLDEMQPEQFVMITMHGRERLRGVFWHAKKHARHSHVQIDNILVIHIGDTNRSLEYSALFGKA